MIGFLTGVFGSGLLIGLYALRQGWVRAFVGLLLVCAMFPITAALGIFPKALFGVNASLGLYVLVSAAPLGAGLICGALVAWLLHRAKLRAQGS